jgi:hypothetical protein
VIEVVDVVVVNFGVVLVLFVVWLIDELLIMVTPVRLFPLREVPGAVSRAAQNAIRSFTDKLN